MQQPNSHRRSPSQLRVAAHAAHLAMYDTYQTSLVARKRKRQDTDKYTARSNSSSKNINIGNLCSAAEQQFDADLQQEEHQQHVPLPKRRITGYLSTGFRLPSSSAPVSTSGHVMQGILSTSTFQQQNQQQQQGLLRASSTAAGTLDSEDVPGISENDAGRLQDQHDLPHDANTMIALPQHSSFITFRPRSSNAPLPDGSKRTSSRQARITNHQQQPAARQQHTTTR